MKELLIRKTTPDDCALILEFIKELAVYEKLLHTVENTEEQLKENLFGNQPVAEVIFAVYQGKEVGFAVFFKNYSTFTGRPGLYLEDLYIKEEFRGKGIGKEMLVYLAKTAVERNYARFEWVVLDWNEPAINFYKSIGADILDEWLINRLSGNALKKLAM